LSRLHISVILEREYMGHMGVGIEYYLPSIETAGNCTGYRPGLNDAEQVQRHSITCTQCTGGLSWVDNNKRNDYR
jgi:hypothetical protein